MRWAEETVVADAYPLCVLWTNKSSASATASAYTAEALHQWRDYKKKAHSKVADLLWRQAQEGFLNFWAP